MTWFVSTFGGTTLLIGLPSMLVLSACARESPRSVSAASLAGCYAFESIPPLAEPLGYQLPDTLWLDSRPNLNPDGQPNPQLPLRLEVIARRPNAGRDSLRLDSATVVPWPPEWGRSFALTAWRFAAPDSVQIVLHANMSDSWDILLRADGDSLVGRAEEYSDYYGPHHPVHSVVAHRTECRARSGAAI